MHWLGRLHGNSAYTVGCYVLGRCLGSHHIVNPTAHRSCRMSSSTRMIAELNWQTLEERRRIARLQMFHKIHYQYVAVSMPLAPKNHLLPTRKENMLAYNIPASNCDYHYTHFSRELSETGTFCLRTWFS